MTREEYEDLQESGFSPQQINQISILETHYFEVDAILQYISPDIDVEYIRNINEIFKRNDDEVSEYDTQFMMKMLKSNLDPNLYLDKDYPEEIKSALEEVIVDIISYTHLEKTNYINLINKIKQFSNEEEASWLLDATRDVLKKMPTVDLDLIFREGFNERQIYYATFLLTRDCSDVIKDIPRIKDVEDYYFDIPNIKHIIETKMDFADICNSYDPENIRRMLAAYERGIIVNDYLLNKPYSNNVLLCEKLLLMNSGGELGDEIIEKCLTLGWEYSTKKDDVWTSIIVLTHSGFDLKEYFTEFPDNFGIKLFEILIEEGCIENEIKRYVSLFEKNNDFAKCTHLEKEDILAIINLYENDYDISKVIEMGLTKKDIDNLLDISIKCDLDFEGLLCIGFSQTELELLDACVKYDRYDIVNAVINVEYPTKKAYKNIINILEEDNKNGTKHKISNLLFDKGNDVFESYDSEYEFTEEQKELLADAMLNGDINEKNVDVIRNNNIMTEKMEALISLMSEGLDVTVIVEKIDDLWVDDIETLGDCLRLGFKLSVDDKTITKE